MDRSFATFVNVTAKATGRPVAFLLRTSSDLFSRRIVW